MALAGSSLHSYTKVLCLTQILFLLLLFPALTSSQSGNDIVYVYDELGRLVAVIDVAGEAAVYSYDAVGNLLSINRYSASVVSVIEFTPNSGRIGAAVTIYGTGFSTTPSQNTVTFNGVAATVTSASATKITTTVPASATTGPISVTSPSGTAASNSAFVVSDSGAPTIADFSPTIGVSGNAVSITGTNFDTTPQNTKTRFNGAYAATTSITSTTIATTVPMAATSGRISVSTPAGTAVSTGDFFVPPPPYVVADVVYTGRMALGESETATIGTANKIGLVVFDGVIGQRITLKVVSTTINHSVLTVYSPTGESLGFASFTASAGFLELPILEKTGTYTILIDPVNANTGNITFNLHNASDLTNTITINGPSVNVSIPIPGQNAQVTFYGNAGQRVSAGVTNSTFGTASSGGAKMSIRNIDGSDLAAPIDFGVGATGFGTITVILPTTGTYSVYLDPNTSLTGSVTLTLSEDIASLVSINGSPLNLNFRAGQNARLTFDGTSGQRVSVGLSDMNLAPGYAFDIGTVAIYKPDGTVLLSPSGFVNAGHGTPTQELPVSGTYSIIIDPTFARTGVMNVRVSADIAETITINGPSLNLNFQPGQNARLTFDGNAGQRVSVGLSDMNLAPGYAFDIGTVAIYKPDGTALLSPGGFVNAGHGTPTQVLPVTGTYSIVVDPTYARFGLMTVTLSEDHQNAITINGAALNLNIRPGQNARLTFDGTSGQRVSVGLSDMNLAPGYAFDIGTVAIYKPDGTALLSPSGFVNAGHGTPTQVLPVTGTYSIIIDPTYARTGLMTVTLSEDHQNAITINGSALNLNIRPGQNARLTFDGNSGQRVSVGLSDMNLAPGYAFDIGTIAIYKPDGTALLSPSGFVNAGHGTPTQVLPVTGTYSIIIDPTYARTGLMTVTLSEDHQNAITINGSALNLNFRPGQNARLTFDGNSGQRVSIGLSGMNLAPGYAFDIGTIAIYKPDGTALLSPSGFVNAGHGTASHVLPTTGTYSVIIDPTYARTGLMTVTLSEDLSPAIAIGGPSVVLTTRIGQNARLNFSGTSGQVVTVVVSSNTIGSTTVALLKPDGTTLTSTTSSATAFNLAASTLPSTGTYSVNVDPAGINAGSITLMLYDPGSSSATLQVDYRFQNTLTSTVGSPPALTNLGSNSFNSATVDGTSTTVLSFAQNDGVSFSPITGVISSNSYSIVMLFSVQQVSGWRRLVDFKNATTDNGLYIENGKLYLYPSASGSSTSIAANTYVQVVVTRNAVGTVIGYVNGTQQFQFTDTSSHAVISTANTIRFFRDDNSASEASAGSVARIRLYDGALTAAQVAALDRLP